jgi:4-hydroxybenzoate polyprenyltransferase
MNLTIHWGNMALYAVVYCAIAYVLFETPVLERFGFLPVAASAYAIAILTIAGFPPLRRDDAS